MVFLFYIIAAGCSFLSYNNARRAWQIEVNPSNPIQSPNYPNNYDNNARKRWQMKVSEGKQIEITFDAFELEYESNCDYDWLKLFDGDGTILMSSCGTNTPTKIISTSNKVTANFYSDGGMNKKGFSFNWKEQTSSVNQIQSPNYPNNYPNSLRLKWPIDVSYGNSIEITFVDFDLEAEWDCGYDWLAIVDGDGSELLDACGSTIPAKIISSSNKVTVSFHTDGSVNKKGFRLTWKAVPGQSEWHQHQFPGIETNVAVGPAGIWGINSAQEIYKKTSNSWEKVDGKLKDISVGHHVWGVNKDDDILRMNEGTWENIPGKLMQVSASGVNGVNGAVWGVKSDNSIHRYRSASSDWERVGEGLMMVSCGQPGVWGVNSHNDIYYRVGTYGGVDSAGQSWKHVPGVLIWISSGSMGDVYGVSTDGSLYKREGITEIIPTGTHWLHHDQPFLTKQVDVFAGEIWGVRKSNQRTRSGNQVLQKEGPVLDENHPLHSTVAKDSILSKEVLLAVAKYDKMCITCSVILYKVDGNLMIQDTYTAGYVESIIKVTKNLLGPQFTYIAGFGIMKINLAGKTGFESLDWTLLGVEESAHASEVAVGVDAKVVLTGGSVSIFDLQIALGLSTEIGIVDDSVTVKYAGTGIKLGRKLGVCVWDSCLGIDFGRLFG
eukprot:GFUD01026978.1.p1 GENE.GFUD01026978.1~~GFUD01026978.1.p1  ORF type:complete len:662 (+),score=98.61 GFUD01026978.1:102-2087(+)